MYRATSTLTSASATLPTQPLDGLACCVYRSRKRKLYRRMDLWAACYRRAVIEMIAAEQKLKCRDNGPHVIADAPHCKAAGLFLYPEGS